ncbi:hypothetical protein DTO013E5_8303 [Penicillium roqueforti]|uniref:ditrans,polycis-polyprenyl diphosphate synthase [(2E,6E)-farnesyldiphosphate specific] n=1 Tax=Penicillium roqueforti (strain FM164) TaxID=1365484 RepID=W6Q109_PENRF|nr:uncharacterized protein LCP9604111_8893 [Penicillium roqueforti]CDM29995.1 Di-trans-poly-cis-decaprenylcistransferase-like [Penicillium roqueforti FM164]KAF9240129.1 hypothetical protein LCP9604111_8893 [Penicillium roqueforti]KAI1831925.1 hypothetical protein CBS147337_7371 [Penicillium roqueforti]KAI2670612.1 hypothetical protein CBS147355_9143 [Penicillium roqueforti]KAI2677596.1 hypothetical protein LCP963914a_7888 [Penicillium roqueforti]
MVSQRDREILRGDLRARGTKLSIAERESLLKSYLPDPTELGQKPSPQSTSERRKTPRKTPVRTFLKSQTYYLTYAITHIIFGIVVRLLQAYHAVIDRIFAIVYHHHRTPELIRKDVKNLKRLPQHLSAILTLRKEDDALAVLMDEIAELAAWSSCSGICQLSIYEKSGVLKSCIPALHQIITTKLASYYGTPSHQPNLQLYAPHHPVHRSAPISKNIDTTTQPETLTILLLSSTDGRETLVDLTKTLADMSQNGKLSPEDITPELVDAEISEITTQPLSMDPTMPDTLLKPEPDLLLVFGPFLKLDGYPPWQLRLTEMYCTGGRSHGIIGDGEAVEYQGYMRGLWHFAGAQMRFGR